VQARQRWAGAPPGGGHCACAGGVPTTAGRPTFRGRAALSSESAARRALLPRSRRPCAVGLLFAQVAPPRRCCWGMRERACACECGGRSQLQRACSACACVCGRRRRARVLARAPDYSLPPKPGASHPHPHRPPPGRCSLLFLTGACAEETQRGKFPFRRASAHGRKESWPSPPAARARRRRDGGQADGDDGDVRLRPGLHAGRLHRRVAALGGAALAARSSPRRRRRRCAAVPRRAALRRRRPRRQRGWMAPGRHRLRRAVRWAAPPPAARTTSARRHHAPSLPLTLSLSRVPPPSLPGAQARCTAPTRPSACASPAPTRSATLGRRRWARASRLASSWPPARSCAGEEGAGASPRVVNVCVCVCVCRRFFYNGRDPTLGFAARAGRDPPAHRERPRAAAPLCARALRAQILEESSNVLKTACPPSFFLCSLLVRSRPSTGGAPTACMRVSMRFCSRCPCPQRVREN